MTSGYLSQAKAVPAAPFELTVGPLLVDPLGYGEADVQFSWKLPSESSGLRQSAYQLVCASEPMLLEEEPDLWDSGWVDSPQSLFIDYDGELLGSRACVFWKVRYRSGDGEISSWSPPASFELALLERDDWEAEWIWLSETDPAESPPAPCFRKVFEVADKPVEKARLYATARGIFELKLNGLRVSEDYFQPEWTDYSKRSLYVTYDVTGSLHPGQNAIGASLGEMWYTGVLGWSTQKNQYGEIPQLLLQLEVTYTDGSREVIATDGSWRGARGPVRYSNIYHGERYDARQELGDWSKAGFNADAWLPVESAPLETSIRLTPRPHQPVRIIEELSPISVREVGSGKYIFDLGQNITGWARLRVPGRAGHTYTLRFAEMLKEDGTLYLENYRAAESIDTYTCAGDGAVEWEPSFTFHGFRYVQVSEVPEDIEPDESWITGVVLHNAMPSTGQFETSSSMLNQLQSNIRWGQKGNFFAVPSDCPQRDERMGWTGDAQVFCRTANFNYNTLAFFVKWCDDLRASQFPTGAIPYYAPSFPRRAEKSSSGWGDAAVIVPWTVYQSFGYKRILEDNYAMMRSWVENYRAHPETEDLVHRGFSFGDWLQPHTRTDDGLKGETDFGLIGTAYFGRSADLLARTADTLGKTEDVATYRELFDEIREVFQRTFFDEEGRQTTQFETQTGYLLALNFGLLDESLRDKAFAHLVRLIEDEADGHLRTGFLGTPLIAPVLSAGGCTDLVYELLFRKTYPGWFYSIEQGATTMWERWDGYSKVKGFADPSMNSFNHYAYGAIGEWLYSTVGGLAAEEPGYRVIRFAPRPGGPLTSARSELETPFGLAQCAWRYDEGLTHYEIVVPPNTRGVFALHGEADKWLEPGLHRFLRGPKTGD